MFLILFKIQINLLNKKFNYHKKQLTLLIIKIIKIVKNLLIKFITMIILKLNKLQIIMINKLIIKKMILLIIYNKFKQIMIKLKI